MVEACVLRRSRSGGCSVALGVIVLRWSLGSGMGVCRPSLLK